MSAPPPGTEARVKDLLDETRLVMLGTQVLMGMQYRAAFENAFGRLPPLFQWLDAVALLLILAAAALLLSTPALHQIADGGEASGRIVHRAAVHLKIAAAPLALALGLDVAIGLTPVTGGIAALFAAALFVLGAALAWFGFPLWSGWRHGAREVRLEDKRQKLEARIVQALTEVRVVLPGAQALFGFQFVVVLTEAFSRLPPASKAAHGVGMALTAVAIILLIAPAAYHRIAAHGNAEERVLRYTVRMMLPAQGLIALSMVAEAYVTVRLITGMPDLALDVALAALAGFAVLLYLLPLLARRKGQVQTEARAA